MINSLELILLLLLASVSGVTIFRKFNLPPMLGYLTVGIFVGPHALNLIGATKQVESLAEFGIVFLMFSVGLEFSLRRLQSMGRIVFGLGLAQVLGSIGFALLAGLIVSYFSPLNWQSAFTLGGAFALSSTAVVIKMLAERLELDSEHGRNIIGVLLFQDLAVVPLLIIIAALGNRHGNLLLSLSLAALKIVVVLALLLFLGRKIIGSWLTFVARRKSQELFILNLLLLTLGAAYLSETLGLSMAFGAFVAGMLIAETPFRHHVEEDIKSFRDVLLGLFFITTGMLLNPKVMIQHPLLVTSLFIGPVLLKLFLITGLARFFGANGGVAIRTGLGLAQAGEFGFVLLSLGVSRHLVEPHLADAALAAMLLSMLCAPFLIQNADRIARRLSSRDWLAQAMQLTTIATQSLQSAGHVVICGYGRPGQSLARILEQENLDYVALDLDPDRVRHATAAGESVVFGDSTRRDALIAAGIHRASAIAITYADEYLATKILRSIKELKVDIPVVVRTIDDNALERLFKAGAYEVIPESVEGSLMLASHLLVVMGAPLKRVLRLVENARNSRYRLLRAYFPGNDDQIIYNNDGVQLRTIQLVEGANAIGKTIGELNLSSLEIQINALRRKGVRGLEPTQSTCLEVHDTLVISGSPESLTAADHLLNS